MKIKLSNVRLAFPALFEPETVNDEGEPRFSATFIFPPGHPCVKEIEAAAARVAKEKWGTKADDILKSPHTGLKICLHNCDEKTEYENCSGNMFIFASNRARPLVIDSDRSALTAADGKPYAGCYVNATIVIWAMDNHSGRRINASLGGVQFLRDGDTFTTTAA